MLDEYQELGHDKGTLGKKTRRVWKRLQWDQSKINDFRKRIDSYMILFSNVIATLNGYCNPLFLRVIVHHRQITDNG